MKGQSMSLSIILVFSSLILSIQTPVKASSHLRPFQTYDHSLELQSNIAYLWWSVNHVQQEILFELHVKTTGWIALGVSPAGGMKGADIAVGWVDSTGRAHIQDRFAFDQMKPVIDNTTQDWFVIQGQENDGWTGIQFKRSFDSCDSMDVPIKSGTNILIFAYGLFDLDALNPNIDLTYHQGRRGSRILPLRSYTNPPTPDKFIENEFFDLRLNNTLIPPVDTTYYCKVFKSPSRYTEKRHAIAHQVLIDSENINLVHHLDLFECGADEISDDTYLLEGICDEILTRARMCSRTVATSWAVGGHLLTEYLEDTGYAVTSDIRNKYFMIKIHYDNPNLLSNYRDSSGIRFYLAKNLRKYDISYILFGAASTPASLAIPPGSERFVVDSYCPPEFTRNLPSSGVTVVSALPHTHLQGISVWTKIIRNNTAIDYLFNAEKFDFNYQFENRLPNPIKIFPGDAFATRCIYNTKNKKDMTLGGQRSADEMCSHTFSYYPLVSGLAACITSIDLSEWQVKMNSSTPIDNNKLKEWLLSLTWNSDSLAQWQEFYDRARHTNMRFEQDRIESVVLENTPQYTDLHDEVCQK